MALRSLYVVLALSMLIATGCRSQSNYHPAPCAPAVVATVPVAPPCPTPIPGPPPGAILVPAPR